MSTKSLLYDVIVSGSLITSGNVFIGNSSSDSLFITSSAYFSSSVFFNNGLTGSLTKLIDGSNYLRAGSNIQLTTGSDGSVTIALIGGGSGDVVGPSSATNDAIAVYDGTTGKLIKNSNLLIGTRTSTQTVVTASVNLTDYGLALIPNGTGSLSSRAPDGTTTGGNARGANSVDFQMVRTSATQVASGIESVIVGGEENTASSDNSFIGGGQNNSVVKNTSPALISANWSFIGGGRDNRIENDSILVYDPVYSAIVGGRNNLITNALNTIAGGYFNTGSGEGGFIGGGISNIIKNNLFSPLYCFIGGGSNNSASSNFAAVAAGSGNTSAGDSSFIGGGRQNLVGATGVSSVIGGGQYNTGSGQYSFVGGGGGSVPSAGNSATQQNSIVVGGQSNISSATYSFIGGGQFNTGSGNYSAIVGGASNSVTALASYSSVVGGQQNLVTGQYTFIGGGLLNTSSFSTNSAIVGGQRNSISGEHSFIGGGYFNTLSSIYSSIVGGYQNLVNGQYSFVGGGQLNTGSGTNSVVIGGLSNTAQSYCETVTGLYATTGAGTGGSFVSTDRLFVVGNGTGTSTRSDALKLFKNGNLHLSGTLTLMSGTTTQSTFPTISGSSGQALVSDGSGTINWSYPFGVKTTIKTKSADETLSAVATLQDDDELWFSGSAGKSYWIEFNLLHQRSQNTATTTVFALSGSSLGYLSYPAQAATNTATIALANGTSTVTFTPTITLTPSIPNPIHFDATIKLSTDAVIMLKWAQGTSSAGNTTTIMKGSQMIIKEVG